MLDVGLSPHQNVFRDWRLHVVVQVSAGLWTQCVSTLNETQQKAIQDLLNTAWAWTPVTSLLFTKPMKKSWAPGSLPYSLFFLLLWTVVCTDAGFTITTPTLLLYNSTYILPTGEQVGHLTVEIGHPHKDFHPFCPRQWERVSQSSQSYRG